MVLYLVQHGEAKTEAEDPQRPLNEQGRRMVEKVAEWAARSGVRVSQIRHSGKRRAEQTAAILAQYLNPYDGVIAVSGMAPNDDVRPTAESLKQEERPLMLVGHLPFLSRLASLLLINDPSKALIQFRMGSILCLSLAEGQWIVAWMITPDLVK